MRTDVLNYPGEVTRGAIEHLGRYATTAARILLGAIFFVFGLDWFLHVLPQPTVSMPAGAIALAGALAGSGYMFPLIKGTEVAVGALLLSNRFVPLALTLVAPVIVNIVAFHLVLAPTGIGMALFVLGMELYLAWSYRAAFAPLVCARAQIGSRARVQA